MHHSKNNLTYFKKSLIKEEKLINQIRHSLVKNSNNDTFEECSTLFDPKISQVYITLFQEKIKKIRWGTKKNTLKESIICILDKLRSHQRFSKFDLMDINKSRILFEMVTEETECNIRNLTIMAFTQDRSYLS